jgi:hypothetical protein
MKVVRTVGSKFPRLKPLGRSKARPYNGLKGRIIANGVNLAG